MSTTERDFRRSAILLAAGLLLLAIPAVPAAAVLEEIIVTAQKREQSIQDVPIAITAFSGRQLKELGFQDSTDIVNMTPGVAASGNIGGQFLTFNIRGVNQSDFADLHESPNAVYIDQVYLSLMQSNKFGLFDSERVEILKGPQGTLYGRNATGGLVHYITRKPTDTFEAYADVTYGSYDQVRFEGAASGPLTANLKARAAILFNRHDEIFENQVAGVDDEWGESSITGRLHLLWEFSPSAEVLLTAFGGEPETSTAAWHAFPTTPVVDASRRDATRPEPRSVRAESISARFVCLWGQGRCRAQTLSAFAILTWTTRMSSRTSPSTIPPNIACTGGLARSPGASAN